MNASGSPAAFEKAETLGMIPLRSDEIHVWLACYEDIDECLHAVYRTLLNAEEQVCERRFYFPRDQRRYLVTRALVRSVLSRYISIRPADWIFSANAYGRPDVVNPEGKNICLSFNISHTHSLIVLGVTRNRAIGVDTENIEAREVSADIANHYFAAPEVAALAAASPHQQRYRFFEYWTFKEAYIKARGMGLSLPLEKFHFQYPDDHAVEIVIDPELKDEPARWQFWQFRPGSQYLVAICAERIDPRSSPSLIIRKTVPLVSEKSCSVQVLRATHNVDAQRQCCRSDKKQGER